MLNHLIGDIKKNNEEPNVMYVYDKKYITEIKNENKNEIKNEIVCIYNKQQEEIDLLHHFNEDSNMMYNDAREAYISG